MPEKTISIIGKDYPQAQSKGLSNHSQIGCKEVLLETLKVNLSTFISDLGETFNQMTAEISNYNLDEIEVNVDISVSGGVRLIGSMESGMSGGVTLKFKRKKDE